MAALYAVEVLVQDIEDEEVPDVEKGLRVFGSLLEAVCTVYCAEHRGVGSKLAVSERGRNIF